MITFALYNLKGGVGKSTSCVNLAFLAAKDGFKALLWDLDSQGASAFYLGKTRRKKKPSKDVLNKTTLFEKIIEPTDYPNLSIIPGHKEDRNLDLVLNIQPMLLNL